jgi:hypothetical protein
MSANPGRPYAVKIPGFILSTRNDGAGKRHDTDAKDD